MPKESTHLFLSHKILQALSDHSRPSLRQLPEISGIINAAPNLFFLGSVAPDSIYNYVSGPAGGFFKKHLAHSHGGEESGLFDYLTRFGEQNLPFTPALSFGLGILSHLTADMVFHPLVFHFCGSDTTGEVSEATVRHYSFESSLDRLLRRLYPELKKEHLSAKLKRKELSDRDFARAQEALHTPPKARGLVPEKEYLSMYSQHARFEGFYGKSFYKYLARFINLLTRGAKPEFPALFYADARDPVTSEEKEALLNQRFSYKNPASGAILEKSLNEMFDDYSRLFLDYLSVLETELSKEDGKSWEAVYRAIQTWTPRSPKTGLPAPRDGKMHHFDFRRLEEVMGLEGLFD